MFHEEEQEVTLTTHRVHLEEVGDRARSYRLENPAPVVVKSEAFEEDPLFTQDVSPSPPPAQPVNRGLQQQPTLTPRRRRSKIVLFISLLFIALMGATIFAVWGLGLRVTLGGADTRTSSIEGSDEYASNQPSSTTAPSVAPSRLPSVIPSQTPSSSQLPSLSFLPTRSPSPTLSPPPSQMPTMTPQPSGSMLPSQLPSIIPSAFPTAPTSAPSFVPTAPTGVPSVSPTRSLVPTTAPSSGPSITRICNGLASNCNFRANQIMYATVHNAMSSQADGFLAFNNLKSMEDALVAGFRGFLLDSCDCGDEGTLMCHSICVAGTRVPRTVFDAVLAFLNNNPFEVIVLEIQVTDDSLWGLWTSTSEEFQNMIYMHTSQNIEWPTLDEMIDMGRRLIVFQHDGGNCDNVGECPVGVSNMFRYGFETNWDIQGVDELMDFELSCPIKTGKASRPNTFMLNNHFTNNLIGLPSRSIAEDINTAEALQSRLDACTGIVGRRTNLLAVDFWSIGDTVQIVNENNANLAEEQDNIFEN